MNVIPDSTADMQQSKRFQLIKQGVMLHIATIFGPLSVVPKPHQKRKGIKLFINEYGLNLILLGLFQLMIFLYAQPVWIVAECIAVGSLFFLSVLQMFIDSSRKSIHVFHSQHHETGLSVRVEDGRWAFFNHYALPIGRKYGIALRSELHRQAQKHGIVLYCYAQNLDVAQYYVHEHSQGVITGTGRPLIVWDYREDKSSPALPITQKQKLDLFGIRSVRNSGSLPIH